MIKKFLIWFYWKVGMWNLRKSTQSVIISNEYVAHARDYLQAHNDYMKKVRDLKGVK